MLMNKLIYKNIVKVSVSLVILFVCQSYGQNLGNQNCKGSTTINQYFGNDNKPLTPGSNSGCAGGPPGKMGAMGPIGHKGNKGDAGPQGEPANATEILELKEELANLRLLVERSTHTPIPPSCSYVSGRSGYYMIQPNPVLTPFSVFCNISSSSRTTVISHDSVSETQMDKCEANYCYNKKVTYDASLAQIESLITISRYCRQFVKFRCQGVVLHNSGDLSPAAWLSRNGNKKNNWGTETIRSCPCGDAGNCVDTNFKCNCDQNSGNILTTDEGYITNRNDLPVTGLQFGDSGDVSEMAWHTLGKLECWGKTG